MPADNASVTCCVMALPDLLLVSVKFGDVGVKHVHSDHGGPPARHSVHCKQRLVFSHEPSSFQAIYRHVSQRLVTSWRIVPITGMLISNMQQSIVLPGSQNLSRSSFPLAHNVY